MAKQKYRKNTWGNLFAFRDLGAVVILSFFLMDKENLSGASR